LPLIGLNRPNESTGLGDSNIAEERKG
jgi:hypothetical protein